MLYYNQKLALIALYFFYLGGRKCPSLQLYFQRNIITDDVTMFLLFSAFLGLVIQAKSEFGIGISVDKNTFFVYFM